MKTVSRLCGLLGFSLLLAFGFVESEVVLKHTPVSTTDGEPVQTFIDETHPYGRRAMGKMPWEHEEKFVLALKRSGTSIRMAAFQTTLPDPLPGEEYNVGLAADLLANTLVQPGQVFSMNKRLGPYSRVKGFREGPAYMGTYVIETIGGGVCKIATTLYNVAILSDMEIVERRAHGMLVPYVPPGQDATVSYGTQDFKFRNRSESPVLIWADAKDNSLFIAFYGGNRPPAIRWRHQILHRQKTWTVARYNPSLKPGEEKLILTGAEGMAVKSWLIVRSPEGNEEMKYLGIDRYKPMPRVIERGPSR